MNPCLKEIASAKESYTSGHKRRKIETPDEDESKRTMSLKGHFQRTGFHILIFLNYDASGIKQYF